MKGKSTCPMCRSSMCFRGITKLKKDWNREKQEQVYSDLMAQILDELMDDYEDIVLQCLEVVQNRFDYIMCRYPKISCETLRWVLGVTWMDVDYLMNTPTKKVYEPPTFSKYLMVSKNEYGVKMKKNLNVLKG